MSLKEIRVINSKDAERVLASVLMALPRALQSLLESIDDDDEVNMDILENQQLIDHLTNCTFLLDSSLVFLDYTAPLLTEQLEERVTTIVRGLVALCRINYFAEDDVTSEYSDYLSNSAILMFFLAAHTDSLLPLRVLVNLSGSGQQWTDATLGVQTLVFRLLQSYYHSFTLHKPQVRADTEDEETLQDDVASDRFSLALALVTNVVKDRQEAKDVIRNIGKF